MNKIAKMLLIQKQVSQYYKKPPSTSGFFNILKGPIGYGAIISVLQHHQRS